MSSESLPTPLVSVPWLASHIGSPWLRIIDASTYLPSSGRDARAEYAAGHIPGAVFCEIGDVSDAAAPYPHTMPDANAFAAHMSTLGIGSDNAIVVYDASGQHFSAPRLWWMLRTFGHDAVAVLDGGLGGWVAAGHALDTQAPNVVSATFTANLNHKRVRDMAAMRSNVDSHAEQVVDARSAGRFEAREAEPRAGVRGGHIPHSRSVHYASLVQPDGTMRPANELRALIAKNGIDTARPIVATCGSGVTACTVVLALHVIGVEDTAVYDGSWTEWGSAADTPIATGPPDQQ